MRSFWKILAAGVFSVTATVAAVSGEPRTESLPVWVNTYGTAGYEAFHSLRRTSDGGFFACGSRAPGSPTCNDTPWVLKLDASGGVVWSKTFTAFTYGGALLSVRPTQDGGCVAAGYTGCYPYFYWWVVKLDASGTMTWNTQMNVAGSNQAVDVEVAPDGGYLVLSDYKPMAQANYQLLLTKLDVSGAVTWSKIYGNTEDHQAGGIAPVSNGYLVAGVHTRPSPYYDQDGFLMKIDLVGNIIWEKYYGGSTNDSFAGISPTADGGGFVVGSTTSSGGTSEPWLLKINSSGTPTWQKSLASPTPAEGRAVVQTSDGGFILYAFIPNPGFKTAFVDNDWFIRFNSSGSLVWQRIVTLSNGLRTDGLALTSDGGIVCTVSSTAYGAGDEDAALLKFSDQGELGGGCPTISDPGVSLKVTTAAVTGAALVAQPYTPTTIVPTGTSADSAITKASLCQTTIPCQITTCGASASPSQGPAPLAVNFTASSSLTYCQASAAYSWSFGDGSTSSQKNPAHTYAAAGTYTWLLTVSAEGATCTQSGTITVTSACAVDCAASAPATLAVGVPATFTLQVSPTGCAGVPAFAWSFGDGTGSDEQSPTHAYSNLGTYTWSASVTVDGIVCQKTGTIQILPACNLSCTAEAPTTGTVGVPLEFALQFIAADCTGSPAFSWSFGDGQTSATQNPTHAYGTAGSYTWTATVTLDGIPCSKSGTVTVSDPCTMTCDATATPASGTAPLSVQFTSTVTTTGQCGGSPVNSWTFGDGSTSAEGDPTHTYALPATYAWTFTAVLNGESCTKSGTVTVSEPEEGLRGDVGIQSGDAFFLLDGPDADGWAILLTLGGSEITRVPLHGGVFSFGVVSPGSYLLRVDLSYADRIAYDAEVSGFGCPAPALGAITKTLSSEPKPIEVQGLSTVARVTFPPPLVFLHGALECYRWWYETDSSAPDQAQHWDNAAREAGYISFTPNYMWYGSNFSWPTAANQVSDEVVADLQGLHAASPRSTAYTFVPWTLVTHDMGGLVARVLALEFQDTPSYFSQVERIFTLGTPNSGSDMLLGGGDNSLLSVNTLLRRFNEVYPDFGEFTGRVVALAGDRDWWSTAVADGPLTLQSALSITRLTCSHGVSANCTPYAHHAFRGSASGVYSYDHYQLGGPESAEEVLLGSILGTLRPMRPGTPESPAGSTIWGTGARTTGTASGTVQNRESATDFLFPIGPTDGLAIGAWVTGGSATFQVLDPSGVPVPEGPSDSYGFLVTQINPQAGGWTLRVIPGPGGATFSAAAAENSPFGIEGYLGDAAYFPGDVAAMRVDLNGSQGGVTPGPCTATLVGLSGVPLQTIPLDPSGGHFTGSMAVPSPPGSYPVTFTLTGSYYGTPFVRTAYERLNVVPTPQRGSSGVFTGAFVDRPEDRDGDGNFDTITLDAQVDLESPGQFAFAAELYDSAGNWVAHGVANRGVQTPSTLFAPISFSLAGIRCSQFTGPFSVRDLVALDGISLAPISLWMPDIATQDYGSGTFSCDPGVAHPALSASLPDEGIVGRNLDVVLSGANLREGATVYFGPGIAVNGGQLLSETAFKVSLSILPDAAPGPRDISLSNPGDAGPVTLAGAFDVKAASSPMAALLSPQAGSTAKGLVFISASAVSDLPVVRVDFQLDGHALASDAEFPYGLNWDTSGVPNGPHTLAALCVDDSGRTSAASQVTVTVQNTVLLPGDCDGDGTVSIGEVQKAINMFLGAAPPDCGADCSGDGVVSIGEVQKVINGFLGIPTPC